MEGRPWSEYLEKCEDDKNYFADGVRQGNPYKEPERKKIQQEKKVEEQKQAMIISEYLNKNYGVIFLWKILLLLPKIVLYYNI